MESQPSAKRVRKFVKPQTIGPKDFFSLFPDDVLRSILGECDGDTAAMMSHVSQRFNKLYESMGEQVPKRRYAALAITWDVLYLDPIGKNKASCQYYIKSTSAFPLPSVESEGVQTMSKSHFVDRMRVKPSRVSKRSPKSCRQGAKHPYGGGCRTSTPALNGIWQRIIFYHQKLVQANRVIIHDVAIDDSFVDKYMSTFKGKFPKDVTILGMNDGEFTRVKNLVSRTAISRLNVVLSGGYGGYTRQDLTATAYDEQTLVDISKSSSTCAFSITFNGLLIAAYNTPSDQALAVMQLHWTPSVEFFQTICRFSLLQLGLLTVEVNDFMRLIEMRFGISFKEDVLWEFTLTGYLHNDNVCSISSDQFVVKKKKTIEYSDEIWSIRKKDVPVECTIMGSPPHKHLRPNELTEVTVKFNYVKSL